MRKILLLFTILLALGLAGCSGNGPAQMLETAKFEELQNNREHAVKLYGEILRKYPNSEEANKARERLSALGEGK